MANTVPKEGPQGFAPGWLNSQERLGHTVEEDAYSRKTGGEASLVIFRAKDSRGLTLLFHGTGNDRAFCWEPLIASLLRGGQSVLTFDLDGHGAASSTELEPDAFWSSSEDLLGYLRDRGLVSQPLNAVGYSLGAALLMRTILNNLVSANRVVFLALPSKVKPYLGLSFGLSELASIFAAPFYRQWQAVGWRHTVPAFGSFRRSSFPLRLKNRSEADYVQLVDAMLSGFDAASHAGKLGQNCLAIFGERDHLTPMSDIRRWQEANPNLKILRVDRSNHFLLPLQDPAIQAITSWICHER